MPTSAVTDQDMRISAWVFLWFKLFDVGRGQLGVDASLLRCGSPLGSADRTKSITASRDSLSKCFHLLGFGGFRCPYSSIDLRPIHSRLSDRLMRSGRLRPQSRPSASWYGAT